MKKLKSNAERARIAQLLLKILIGVLGVSMISSIMQWFLVHRAKNGAVISMDEANLNDIREFVIVGILAVFQIIFIVYFIMWFRRAYFNLHLMSKSLRYTEGWAAGAWFVPIMNLYAPFTIMKELFHQSEFQLNKQNIVVESLKKAPLNLWWTFWISGQIIQNIANQLAKRSGFDLQSLYISCILDIIGTGLMIGAAVSLLKIIKNYALAEVELLNMNSSNESFSISSNPDLLD